VGGTFWIADEQAYPEKKYLRQHDRGVKRSRGASPKNTLENRADAAHADAQGNGGLRRLSGETLGGGENVRGNKKNLTSLEHRMLTLRMEHSEKEGVWKREGRGGKGIKRTTLSELTFAGKCSSSCCCKKGEGKEPKVMGKTVRAGMEGAHRGVVRAPGYQKYLVLRLSNETVVDGKGFAGEG